MTAQFSGCEQLAAPTWRVDQLPQANPGREKAATPRHPVATDLPAWEIQAHRPWRPTRMQPTFA
jgi:hypothetical protein